MSEKIYEMITNQKLKDWKQEQCRGKDHGMVV